MKTYPKSAVSALITVIMLIAAVPVHAYTRDEAFDYLKTYILGTTVSYFSCRGSQTTLSSGTIYSVLITCA